MVDVVVVVVCVWAAWTGRMIISMRVMLRRRLVYFFIMPQF